MLQNILAFIKLGRFLFLAGGFVMTGLGASIAYSTGVEINWMLYFQAQAIVTATQLMVHYSNDYFDYHSDLLNTTYTKWSGGSRVLPDGHLPPWVALAGALVFGAVALILTILLQLSGTIDNLAFGLFLIAIFLSWAYSSPPFNLHSRTLGEISATLVLAFFTPLISYYIQSETLKPIIFWALFPLLFLQFNMLLSVHLPDASSDKKTGKQTLAVRLGHARSLDLYQIVLVVAYLILPIALKIILPLNSVLLSLLPLPIAIGILWKFRFGTWQHLPNYEMLAFWSIGLLMSTATMELIGFIVA